MRSFGWISILFLLAFCFSWMLS